MTSTIQVSGARTPRRVGNHRPATSGPFSTLALPPHAWIVSTAMALASTVVMCVRNSWVFSVPVREDGDFAANSILVNQAVHFQLLVGNYSREGFNHPGPAYLYIQSFGQDIFYSWLHVVPAFYNGQLLAVFVLNSIVLALVAVIVARHTRSWTAGVLAVSVVLLMTGGTLAWASSWMPYLYAGPFLLAGVAGVSVASGALRDLPAFTFAVAMLVHGHVAFIGMMGVYVVLVVVAWMVLHRPRHNYVVELRSVPWHLIASGGIVVLFALPIVLELVLHWPGQFGLYLHYARTNANLHPHSLGSVASYVGRFWPGGHVGKALVLLAALSAAVLAAFDPDRRRRRFVLGLLIAVAVLSAEVALYADRGVDYLSLTYTGYFYYSIPALVVGSLVAEGAALTAEAMGGRSRHGHVGPRVQPALALSTAAVAVAVLATQASLYDGYRGDPALPRVAAAVWASPLRMGRAVAINLGPVGYPTSDWPDVTGLLMAASRDGYQPCVANPAWRYVMTSQYTCTAPQAEHRWTITVDQASVAVPPGAALVFRNSSLEVFQPARSARPSP